MQTAHLTRYDDMPTDQDSFRARYANLRRDARLGEDISQVHRFEVAANHTRHMCAVWKSCPAATFSAIGTGPQHVSTLFLCTPARLNGNRGKGNTGRRRALESSRVNRTPLTDTWMYLVVLWAARWALPRVTGISSSMNTFATSAVYSLGNFYRERYSSFRARSHYRSPEYLLLSEYARASQKRAGELLRRLAWACGGLSTMSRSLSVAAVITAGRYAIGFISLPASSGAISWSAVRYVEQAGQALRKRPKHNSTSNNQTLAVLADERSSLTPHSKAKPKQSVTRRVNRATAKLVKIRGTCAQASQKH